MRWYLAALNKYAEFSGRARRAEYWLYMLIHILVLAVLIILMIHTFFSLNNAFHIVAMLLFIYLLITFLPSLAVTVHRLHDMDFSGWWILIVFFSLLTPPVFLLCLILLFFKKGTKGNNFFGEDPIPAEEYEEY